MDLDNMFEFSVTDIIQALCAIIALIIGIRTMLQTVAQLKDSALANILTLEIEIKNRSNEVSDISYKINALKKQSNFFNSYRIKKKIKKYETQFNVANENYLNVLDRFCYCILHDYFKSIDWKGEYGDYIKNTILTFYSDIVTRYKNIMQLYYKWQLSPQCKK